MRLCNPCVVKQFVQNIHRVDSFSGVISTPPIFIGNRAFQSTSRTGLKNLLPDPASATDLWWAVAISAPANISKNSFYNRSV